MSSTPDVMEGHIFTYQTRLLAGMDAALDAYAELYGRVERTLFAESTSQGIKSAELKNDYLKRFGITGRQFNAIRVGLEGKIDAIKTRREGLLDEARARLKKAQATVKKLGKAPKHETPEARKKRLFKRHQKIRRVHAMEGRFNAMQADHKAGRVRMDFGSRKLFHAQFDLQANGYDHFDSWRDDWRRARSSQFMVLGSKDETAGCQGCVVTIEEDGTFSLRLRMPDSLTGAGTGAKDGAGFGKYVDIPGLRFDYGREPIIAALASSRMVERPNKAGKLVKTRTGRALTYRFLRDDKGWRVFVSVEVDAATSTSLKGVGAVGVDFNADHLAVAEIDRHGNLSDHARLDLFLRGMTSDQRQAAMGEVVKQVVQRAVQKSKPIVIEKLDFREKKARLEGVDRKRACILSALAYRQFDTMLRAAAFRAGVTVIDVNPAYTSVIGAVNHAARLGISTHLAAAYAIARRGLGLSERPLAYRSHGLAVAPVRHGGHVAFALPVRNRAKHVWSQWADVRKRLLAAHAEHDRSGAAKASPAPLPRMLRDVCAIRFSRVQSPGANRQQHCSADVPIFEDVPY